MNVSTKPYLQAANTGVCLLSGADHRQRCNSSYCAALGNIFTVHASTLLVGAVRCRLGGYMERSWTHYASVQTTKHRGQAACYEIGWQKGSS